MKDELTSLKDKLLSITGIKKVSRDEECNKKHRLIADTMDNVELVLYLRYHGKIEIQI